MEWKNKNDPMLGKIDFKNFIDKTSYSIDFSWIENSEDAINILNSISAKSPLGIASNDNIVSMDEQKAINKSNFVLSKEDKNDFIRAVMYLYRYDKETLKNQELMLTSTLTWWVPLDQIAVEQKDWTYISMKHIQEELKNAIKHLNKVENSKKKTKIWLNEVKDSFNV